MLLLIKSRQADPSIKKLKSGSHKMVYARCDFCGDEIHMSYRYYYDGKKKHICNKTACAKCKYKKAQLTNLERYGDKIITRTELVKIKRKQTCLRKYGVEYASQRPISKEKTSLRWSQMTQQQRDEIQKKRKETTLKKYGVTHHSQRPEYQDICKQKWDALSKEQRQEILNKRNETQELLYGGYYSKTEECKKKIKQTSLTRYGVDHYSKTEERDNRVRQTSLEKHGVEWAAATPEAKTKKEKTNLQKYGRKNAMQNPDIAAKAKATAIKRGIIKLYGGKRIEEWAEIADLSRQHAGALLRNYGPDFLENFKRSESDIEQIIRHILDDLKIPFTQHGIIGGRKSDFLIENNKLVIECDGLYWHNDQNKEKQYHLQKKKTYEERGYRVLFFRQDEIIFKPDIVRSIISNACQINNARIFARKCEVVELDKEKATDFFLSNHLMGSGKGRCFSLGYNGDIVCALQVYSRGSGQYEISRFCSVMGLSVVGGFSKLLKYIEQELNISSVITFIDERYGKGDYLKNLGFEFKGSSISFKWTNSKITLHRMAYPGSSGYDHGMAKIWDCGQAKYIKVCK